jgi:predicted small metal-binding protein
MKKIGCPDCDKEFSAETEKEVLDKMHPHYMDVHKDIMKDGTEAKRNIWRRS